MRPLLLFITTALLAILAPSAQAVVLDWSVAPGNTWTGGTFNNSFDVDGVAGNDIQVAITTTGTVVWNAGDPVDAVQNTVTGLRMGTTGLGQFASPGTVTVTITFLGTYAAGVYASLYAIDVDSNGTTGTTFTDRLTNISGVSSVSGSPIGLTEVGGAHNTVTGSGTLGATVLGTTNSFDGNSNVLITSDVNKVTSITFTWSNPNDNSGAQTVTVGNITFFTTPEVGSSMGALLLCGGAAAFIRRRPIRVAA